MLNIKDITNHFDNISENLSKRGKLIEGLEDIKNLLIEKNAFQKKIEILRAQRNSISKEHQGKIEDTTLLNTMKEIKKNIDFYEKELLSTEEKANKILYIIPNLIDDSVPYGKSEEDNKEVFKWGEPKNFDFTVKSHEELGEQLDILDMEQGVNLSGSRFYVLKKQGALLERAIAQFFLEEAIQKGYTEIFAPFLVKQDTLFGTGQLPKFKSDLFKIEDLDMYLIPTAEVTITSLYKAKNLKEKDLPMHLCSYSSCFRKEAGSYGKDTKGILRVHQFQKVELVHYSKPENSMEELEKMVNHAESLLQKLELPYRKVLLCSGDIGFSAKKTYDLEVYVPSQKKYREISSCSNCGDFQARRMGLKFKDAEGNNQYVHTLNGSGLAIGRTWLAIVENYQNKDGSISIPKILQKYMYDISKIGAI